MIQRLLIFAIMIHIANSEQLLAQTNSQWQRITIDDISIERVGGNAYGGGQVEINFDAFAGDRIGHNSVVILTPILVGDSTELIMPSIVALHRKGDILMRRAGVVYCPEMIVLRPGQLLNYSFSFEYESWCENAMLKVRSSITQCKKTYQLPIEVIAYDIELVARRFTPHYALPTVEPQPRPARGVILFADGNNEVVQTFSTNTQNIEKLSKAIYQPYPIEKIELSGSSSPEGAYDLNVKLSEQRTQAVANYLISNFQIARNKITQESVAENWSELQESIESSDLHNRSQILSIIEAPISPQMRDTQLEKLPNYTMLHQQYYPSLRRVDYRIVYSNGEYQDAQNNLTHAVKLLQEGQISQAQSCLQQANSALEREPNSELTAIYYNTLGLLKVQLEDFDGAQVLFERAASLKLPQAVKNLQSILSIQ